MRHALFVAFHYPPEASSSGFLRTLKYTRYLGKLGWRVTVLTLNRNAYAVTDTSLEAQIPAEVRVVRTSFVDVKRHLAVRGVYWSMLALPDRWIGWWPWAVAAGQRILKSDPVDMLYSTSPHATAHVVAGSLSRGSGVPWVADFRDPWYEDPPEPGTPRATHATARQFERSVVRRAHRVVATTNRFRDLLAARYPEEPRRKFVAIPNGYDEPDFASPGPDERRASGEFLVVHAGSVNTEFRNPRPLFEAIRQVGDAGLIDPARLRLRFLGGGPFGDSAEMRQAIERTKLNGRVEFLPRVPYAAALSELRNADLLLLLQASRHTVDLVPAKLFEYLRAGRPVLALAGDGATAEVLNEVGGGWAVDPADGAGLREAIRAAYDAWTNGSLRAMTANPVVLQKFTRERLTNQLVAEFDSVMRESLIESGSYEPAF